MIQLPAPSFLIYSTSKNETGFDPFLVFFERKYVYQTTTLWCQTVKNDMNHEVGKFHGQVDVFNRTNKTRPITLTANKKNNRQPFIVFMKRAFKRETDLPIHLYIYSTTISD